jgi:hypothetical protein
LDLIKLYAVETEKWSDEKYTETYPAVGDSVTIKYPNSLYLTFLSNKNTEHGNFEANYSVKLSPAKAIDPFVGSLNFFILVSVGGFVVVAVIMALIIYLCITSRKNKKLETQLKASGSWHKTLPAAGDYDKSETGAANVLNDLEIEDLDGHQEHDAKII